MRCYYHNDVDAVGICKSCSKGLCGTCAVEVGNGIACRDRCEEEVRSLNRVIDRNKTAYEKTSGAYVRVALFYATLGVVVLVGGLLDWRGYGWLLTPAGLIFLVSGYLHFSTGRKFRKD